MTISEWAANLQREVYHEWLNKHKEWEPGFKVFYGPVRVHPELMIISLQPGGNSDHYLREDLERFKKGDFSTHDENTYIKSGNRFAKAMRAIFHEDTRLLEESVILPVIFWRAKSYSEWKRAPDFNEMENFSFAKVRQIIEKLKPHKILLLGNSTGKKLSGIFEIEPWEIIYRRNGASKGHSVARSTKMFSIPTLNLMHPTGARLSKKDEIERNKEFRNWLSRNS